MKKFSKLLAVLVTLAVIICPMTSAIVANATVTGSYSIVAEDANNVVLTISSTDGFLVYLADVTFNNSSAFQSSYSSDGYTNGLKVIDYTLKTGSKDSYNLPAVSANYSGATLSLLVSATDSATLDLYTEVQVGIRVASGSTANLAKIQAADEGDVTTDPSLLGFGSKVNATTGAVDLTNNDNATTGVAHTHNYTKATPYEVSAPTCTALGVYRKTCETCGAVDNSSTYYGSVYADHNPSVVNNTADNKKSDATCTEAAVYYYECSVCGQAVTESMQGFTGTRTVGTALGHNMTNHEAVTPTCTTGGNSQYYSCDRCGKFFSDAAGNTEIAANSWNLAATGHTPVTIPAVAATCTTAGSTAGTKCSVCNEVLTAPTPIAALGHNMTTHAAVAATCTTAGNSAYYSCDRCNKYFSDAEGNTEIANGSWVIPATGHTEVAIPAVAATCTTAGSTAGVKCSVCDAILTAPTPIAALGHNMTPHAANAATCTAAGNSAYWSCDRCNKFFSDAEGNTEIAENSWIIAATGHTEEVIPAVAATCTTAGSTAGVKCSVCDAILTAPTPIAALGHNMTPHAANAATCTAAGNSAYWSCDRCNKFFSDAEGETEIAEDSWVIPATGHTPVTDAAVAATCTSTGLTEGSHCSVCSAVLVAQTETPIDPTNHTNIVNDAAVAATCTETGLTAGSHCAACDTVIVAQETVNALGHNYTYTDHGDGTHDIGCTRCDYAANETCVDANEDGYCDLCNAQLACEHNYVGVVTTQPTKNATGVMTYTCSLCGDSYTEPIAIPTVTSAVTFSHALNVSAVVADQITVSTKQMRTNFGEGATYFIDVAYETYSSTSDLYNLTNAHTVLTSANRETSTGTSTANKDIIFFKKMALYEMTLDFDMTLYIKNEAGVVVAYSSYESSIADMALALATQYPSNTNLLTCLADMCNYGKAAQEFFAAANPTKDIVSAVDPTVVLGDYMVNASDISILPGAGEYDNTKVQNNKIDPSTGFISANMTLNIASSNRIQYTLRADDYDLADCEIVMSYTSLYGAKEVNVDMSELTPNGLTGAGKQKYLYQFGDLPIYDVNAVVTMSMYHNGVLEMTSQYSVGNFVNTYVEAASDLGTVMRTMELFANSTAIQLGQGSIF